MTAVRFVKQAQAALGPLIAGMAPERQAQIIVDFVRQGPDNFWNRVKAKNGLNDAQLKAWIQAQQTCKGPRGVVPGPLKPNPDNFQPSQYFQIKSVLNQTK